MKYLVISALLVLVFLVVYSRLKPYLRMIQHIAKMFGSTGSQPSPGSITQSLNQLICCAACKTWVPAERAVGSRAGLPPYCSTECLEKAAVKKKHKLAG